MDFEGEDMKTEKEDSTSTHSSLGAGCRRPQQYAQKVKAGRGWLIVRNSATLAQTDYGHIADEIVSALNAGLEEKK